MISLENIRKTFGTTVAVNDITLDIHPGEIFGLVGPDGAGKTTVIRMLTGILTPSSGKLSVLGASNPETVKQALGYVPQKFSLFGDLTVMENIRLMGALYGKSDSQIAALAAEILGFTHLLPFKDRLADNLSGGMKQKLALACGLLHRPKIYFLDEPTTGVDPVSRREFWRMLYRLNKDGTTIFVSTPYMDEAEFCTRVAFIHSGAITSCDTPINLRQNYPYQILELATPDRQIKQHLTDLGLVDINSFGAKFHLVTTDAEKTMGQVRQLLAETSIPILSLKTIPPSLEDVFVALAREVA
jgi:ABC-2 type transport system ATP-binding protein